MDVSTPENSADQQINAAAQSDDEYDEQSEHQREVQGSLQACIDRVLQQHVRRPVREIKAALQEAIAADGHPAQPHSWIRAVVEEIADGRRYVVDTRSAQGRAAQSAPDRDAPPAADAAPAADGAPPVDAAR